MCGFFGEIATKPSEVNLAELHKSIFHRGPDDSGSEKGEHWMLGFNRLSIIDLSESGHQPMWDSSHRYVIVFNGEIYNYKELKETFVNDVTLRSSSDTEILLRLLIDKKESALQYLNGMFSFVFIDTVSGDFIAARDRLGVKPFYYFYNKTTFRFASELKALLKWPDATRDINPEALNEYLFLKYISGEKTIFKDYYKLKAAHFIKGNFNAPEHLSIQRYWEMPVHEGMSEKSIGELEESFESIFSNAVSIRLRSDVPVGIFLSGGIDSSLVGAFASKTSHREQIAAFTVGYNEKKYDESGVARQTAKHLGIRSETILLGPSRLSDIDTLVEYYDEPFADSSALPSYHLCKAAAEHGTVFLTGDGGDESFAGYRRYIRALNNASIQNIPGVLKSLSKTASSVFAKYSNIAYKLRKVGTDTETSVAFMDDLPYNPIYDYVYSDGVIANRSQWVKDKMEQYWLKNGFPITAKQQYWDLALYLPDDILVKMDRASMANSIEVRSPFLDYRIVEWAATIPGKYLIDNQKGKKLLRDLCNKYLPSTVTNAPKSGFGVPLHDWFAAKEGNAFFKQRITDPSFALKNNIKVDHLCKIADMHMNQQSQRRFGEFFWAILMYDAWYRKYMY
ncbi:MAG TPA: asparagine synthase (glutamine-hydrolyzing) [Flavipsychrobacter sp.]|nr:asparagine synthase (glutamine-hydrolyzing) [Flavipsychrobacter sp.]